MSHNATQPMPGCEVELHGVEKYELEGCLVALGLFVVVLKRCCSGGSIRTKQFASDCVKLLAGAVCVYAVKRQASGLQQLLGVDMVEEEDEGSCVWHGTEAVADATLGPLVVFVFFGLVRNLVLLCCRCNGCVGLPNLLTPGACTLQLHGDSRFARLVFLVQLVLWAAVVTCAKVLTLIAMVSFSAQASSLAQEKLIPLLHEQLRPLLGSSPRSARLRRLAAAVVVPAVATSFQFMFWDCIFVHFARKAPQATREPAREPLLEGGAAQHLAAHNGAPGGSRAEAADDWGPQYTGAQRIHYPQDRAEGEDPEDLGGARCGCTANIKQLKTGFKNRLVSITQPGRDPV